MAFIGILLMVTGLAAIVLLGIQGLTIGQTIAELGLVFGIKQAGPSEPEGPGGRTNG